MSQSDSRIQDLMKQSLSQSIEDHRFDQDEKLEIQSLLQGLDEEWHNFSRNQAFKVYLNKLQQILSPKDELTQSINDQNTSVSSEALRISRWLEKCIKAIDSERPHPKKTPEPRVYFSPGKDPKNAIIQTIQQAQRTIDICVFTISDNDISQALVNAHQSGLRVRILSDNDKSEDRGSDIDWMERKGLPVVMDDTANHMHHKFAIIDSKILINGSFNWTRSATTSNNENITILEDQNLIQKFESEFNKLWNDWIQA